MEKDFLSFFVKGNIALLLFSLFIISVNANCIEGQIDINTAPISDLQKLSGIGPAYAQRIIEGRPFSSIDDLLRVKGIGNATLQKIKNQGLACVSSSNQNQNSQNNDNSPSKNKEEPKNSEKNTSSSSNQQQPQTTNTDNEQNQPIRSQQQVSNSYQKIDINSAPISSLTKITGVGEKTAQEIINSRPFCSLDDLLRVKGIGQKTLEKIKEQEIAYVEENFCKTDTNKEKEEKISLGTNQNQQTNYQDKKILGLSEDSKKESIINLDSNKEETKTNLATGKVVYESKTEKIRKYAIYFFAALLVVIVVLILKD